ncbi:unnamed protein product [Aphanomyces euteiches]|uniref:DNA-directed RNA polymerase n=1 Tax=Aphanomyces euteiches TaxID=100861 RepID=A0A6G0WK02_9STRA|nr:hypothetical protein Ae201684_014405 [Aphanomyces euteiches]KAH9088785.1 hypothetical protein Ae201684P_012999 [Aphanomyces euteiches]
MQSVFRRWLSHPSSATRRVSKLPRWQQHALSARANQNQIRHKASVPAALHQLQDDDDEYDSDDDFRGVKKADWYERALSLKPEDRRVKFPVKRSNADRPAVIDTPPTIEVGPEYSLNLDFYDNVSPKKHVPARLGDMTKEEVDAWLEGFEIPEEAAKLNKTPEEIRHLYAKQLRLEQATYMLSVEKHRDTTRSVVSLQKASDLKGTHGYIRKWVKPVSNSITSAKEKFADLDDNERKDDQKVWGPILFLLDPDEYAIITATNTLNHVLIEADGVKFVKLTLAIGKEIQDALVLKRKHFEELAKICKKDKYEEERKYAQELVAWEEAMEEWKQGKEAFKLAKMNDDSCKYSVPKPQKPKKPSSNKEAEYWKNIKYRIESIAQFQTAKKYFDDAGSWSKEDQVKIGSKLVELLIENAHADDFDGNSQTYDVEHPMSHLAEAPPQSKMRQKAFVHAKEYINGRNYGFIRCTDVMYDKIMKGEMFLPWCARYLPMIVPPKPWTGISNGGYLTLPTKIMRHRDSKWQMECVSRGEIDGVIRSLNNLADIPWVINSEVLNVVMELWKRGGDFGDLPPRADMPMPEMPQIEQYMEILDPVEREEKFEADMETYKKMCKKVEKKNREYNSLRCDTLYKLQVAQEFQHEDAIYFPYNMDFRGRVYPIPPNLNHLGSDMSRALLIFKNKKPLGVDGLYWLKVHLAGLYGIDKCSFDDRVKFVDEHMPQIMACAAHPLADDEDSRWWQEAEAPFLTLGVIFELARAVQSPNPEEFMSNLPVHMDGSCNGLQHYAALGRDKAGAEQVNLIVSDKPQDVYSGVAARVIEKIESDFEMEMLTFEECLAKTRVDKMSKWLAHKKVCAEYEAKCAEYEDEVEKNNHIKKMRQLARGKKGKEEHETLSKVKLQRLRKPKEPQWYHETEDQFFHREAKYELDQLTRKKEFSRMLLNRITRKVVKQTVMTSVYGVTAIGARKQINARLDEVFLLEGKNMDEELEETVYNASKYTSDLTMRSMGDLFSTAREIMEWLAKCTEIVAEDGQMMSWITPLGLPVTQPYRKSHKKQVRTSLQHVILSLPEAQEVNIARQKSAFPPNYVHSLDSTHMMMTALKVIGEDKLDFAAVHDSYWTHACSVERMNSRLREEFVDLYSQPLLEDLREQLMLRFPDKNFPELPKPGELDLKEVLRSPYFFN